MKQVLHNLKTGRIEIVEVPVPALRENGILVNTHCSLLSAGTDRALLNLASKSYMAMAMERPDLVRRVAEKWQRDGALATLTTVRQNLSAVRPIGYSLAGVVAAVGKQVSDFAVGDRVACMGAGWANHAEVCFVPRMLAQKIPETVTSESAAYGALGAIALHAFRNADVAVGATVVIVGLGLIGLLTTQIAKAAGCRVIGIDLLADRVELARQLGADLAVLGQDEDVARLVADFTARRGADAVILATATKKKSPFLLAGKLARDRGRVVLVGVAGTEFPRDVYYHKELTLVVSRSYGPGRYDDRYESQGHDYPIGHTRWTEGRNLEAFLLLVGQGKVDPARLTTHRFSLADAGAAYKVLLEDPRSTLGVALTYEVDKRTEHSNVVELSARRPPAPLKGELGVSFVGVGQFAQSTLLPILSQYRQVRNSYWRRWFSGPNRPSLALRGVVAPNGHSAATVGPAYGFQFAGVDVASIENDPFTNVVVLATPHRFHAPQAISLLRQGKAVWIEKPLAVSFDQLRECWPTLKQHAGRWILGFNRRFAPLAQQMKAHLVGRGPMAITYRINAGPAPTEHWLCRPENGGRIVGEVCHFVDFASWLVDSHPTHVIAQGMRREPDNVLATISFDNGSVLQLAYDPSTPIAAGKEWIEARCSGRSATLRDFRAMELFGGRFFPKRRRFLRPDKGHRELASAFLGAISSGRSAPIDADSMLVTTLTTFAIEESVRRQAPITLAESRANLEATTMSETPPVYQEIRRSESC